MKIGNKKKVIIAAIAFIAVIVVFGFLYKTYAQKPVAGEKDIQVEVIQVDGESKIYDYETDYEFLGEVLLEEKLVEGEAGEYGLFIQVVDGIRADDTKQQWWCITKDGGQVNTSADTTPIFEGDKYELTLKEGY